MSLPPALDRSGERTRESCACQVAACRDSDIVGRHAEVFLSGRTIDALDVVSDGKPKGRVSGQRAVAGRSRVPRRVCELIEHRLRWWSTRHTL